MIGAYDIIDFPGPSNEELTGADEILEHGEISAIIDIGRSGLSAYVSDAKWDNKKVLALFKKHGIRYDTIDNDRSRWLEVQSPNPDETLFAFLNEFIREVAQDPTLEFKIKELFSDESIKQLKREHGNIAFDRRALVYGVRK